MSELHKPLPALPKRHSLATLSVESRNHRARLIKHFLTDIQEPGVQARRDGWLYVFEEVLDELSVEMVRGDWLACVKRGKELKRCLRIPPSTDKSSSSSTVTNSKRAESRKTTKDDSPQEKTDEPPNKKNSHPLPPTPDIVISPFEMLIGLVAPPLLREEEQRAGHIVLCLAPHGSRTHMPTEDSGFDILPANIGCSFSPAIFNLQKNEDEFDNTILYGLGDLEGNLRDTNLRLIGGTFTFKGVNSPMQHMLLSKVLRLSIYVHLALILEQHLLSDSGVEVKMSRPKLPTSSPSTPLSIQSESRAQEIKLARPRIRNSIMPSSFTNFFLKRSLSQRAQSTTTTGRGGSLDLTTEPPQSVDSAPELTPRKSHDGHNPASGLRFHRFSFMGERHLSLRRTTQSTPSPGPATTTQPFVLALKRIEESKDLLSTSPKTIMNLPKLLVDLAEKETANTNETHDGNQVARRRLKGDERVALTSLLGWDGKDAEGRGMSGILGFVRQQEISVLCSLHVPSISGGKKATTATTSPELYSAATTTSSSNVNDTADQEGSSAFTNNTVSSTSSASTAAAASATIPFNLPATGLSSCGKPYWITYRYYSSETGDSTLGEWIEEFTKNSNLPCERPGCKYTKGQHEIRLIHDGVRIVFRAAEVEQREEEGKENEQGIRMWESCAVCAAKTSKVSMDDGTYLLSYAKFLELLLYAPSLCVLTPALCDHTTPPSGDLTSMLPSRFNIIRHFSTSSGQVSLALSPIEDIFELRVPRLQITRGMEKYSPTSTRSGSEAEPETSGDKKKILRKEIKRWWEGVSDHIDKLEKVLNAEEMAQKALPRLPSMDEAYDLFDTIEAGSGANTPTPATHSPLPPLPPTAFKSSSEGQEDPEQQPSHFTTQSSVSTDTQASKTPTVPPKEDSGKLLATLRHNFQKIEQSLYTQLAKTPEESLNDVRRSFIATGKGTQKRLKAWQAKHIGPSKAKLVRELITEEPEWWGKGCHAVPGGNIIVRENDWGSIIAHTLSTADYQLELANLSIGRSAVGAQSITSTPRAITDSGTSSFFSVAAGYRLFTSSSKNQPDPDQEDVVWNEPEQYSAVISRKDHARDPTSLLSIRDVLRQNAAAVPEQSGSATPTSRLAAVSSANAAMPGGGVNAKADVALSIEAAGAKLEPPDRSDSPGLQLLQEIGSNTPTASSKPASVKLEPGGSSTATEENTAEVPKDASANSAESDHHVSQATIGKDDVPPPLPPKDVKAISKDKPLPSTSQLPAPSTPAPTPADQNANVQGPPPPTSSGFAHVLAHGINSAMRFVLKTETPPASPSPSASNATKHHALLGDITTLDERPHIKYDWTIGKRLKFSCTVYYAKQFDILRKRCGINNDGFLQSLSRSTNWTAEGGKSKSNFWKTSDQRYVIKTLVNAWNVADLQVLVDLAPSYFRYMDATASRATVLAKLIGFYTIEIRNLETGAVQSKADLLVMENLFFGQKISKTFDLKGIQGRKVKAHGDTTKTLFDGEWIEGQQRTLTLVRPHSKLVLHEAIKHDAEFLSKSNIMDYSLLLGIDEEKKEIVCGLVDTIGSYTFAKTLEYKAKHGLQSGKEVTVVPPAEYQERFVNALEGYFVACPDKWSKPFDESKIVSDPNLLPSVL